jgi:hypothetical protein
MEENKDIEIPKHIIDTYVKTHDLYPCITKTRNVISDAIELLTKKNKVVWFYDINNGERTIPKDGLIDYNSTYKIMVYFSMIDKERTYKLFIFSTTENKLNVDLLLKGLNKFYTIDMI